MIGRPRGTTKDTSSLTARIQPEHITFSSLIVRVPTTGRVQLPGVYAHEFASTPLYWKTVETTAKYVYVPILEGRLTLDRG